MIDIDELKKKANEGKFNNNLWIIGMLNLLLGIVFGIYYGSIVIAIFFLILWSISMYYSVKYG